MLEILSWFESPVAAAISFFVGVVSLLVAVKLNRVRKPRYFLEDAETRVVWPPGIITTLYLWNAGKEAIRKEDMPVEPPVRVTAPDTIIRSVKLGTQIGVGNRFRIENCSRTQFDLLFDYLDQQEGCAITIEHSGPAPARDVFKVSCRILGASYESRWSVVGLWVALLVLLMSLMAVLSYLGYLLEEFLSNHHFLVRLLFGAIAAGVFGALWYVGKAIIAELMLDKTWMRLKDLERKRGW